MILVLILIDLHSPKNVVNSKFYRWRHMSRMMNSHPTLIPPLKKYNQYNFSWQIAVAQFLAACLKLPNKCVLELCHWNFAAN